MKVKIKKKGSEDYSEIEFADFLLGVNSVSDRNDERTININGETYLLDTIEDLQKEKETEASSETSVSTETVSESESPAKEETSASEEAAPEVVSSEGT
jgi:hypothetical protein